MLAPALKALQAAIKRHNLCQQSCAEICPSPKLPYRIQNGQPMLPHFAPTNFFFFYLGCRSSHSLVSGYQGCSKGSLQAQSVPYFSCVWNSMWLLTSLIILGGSFHLTVPHALLQSLCFKHSLCSLPFLLCWSLTECKHFSFFHNEHECMKPMELPWNGLMLFECFFYNLAVTVQAIW